MDLIILVLACVGGFAIWRFFFKPNTFDKLSLLSLGVWKSQYDQSGLMTKTGMASSLMNQAASVSERLGSGTSFQEFRGMISAEKVEVNELISNLLEHIYEEMDAHLSVDDVNHMPAAVIMGLMFLKGQNAPRFEVDIQSPDQLLQQLGAA
jgi:hypothetical protein